jgi:hypothetical protein
VESDITVVVFFTLKQVPPASFKVKAVIPFPDSTIRRWPSESKRMLRGDLKPLAMMVALNPGAMEGAGYFGEIELEQDDWASEEGIKSWREKKSVWKRIVWSEPILEWDAAALFCILKAKLELLMVRKTEQ